MRFSNFNSFLLASVSLLLLITCHKEGSEDFLFTLTQAPPVVMEISPQRVTPRQTGTRPIEPTRVTIRGRDMGDPGLEIFFNETKANIIYNLGNEILTEVPDGTISGRIFAKKPGAQCLPDSSEGFNCSSKEFFVDCYNPYNNEYGKEITLTSGETKRIEFDGSETKAFRAELSPLSPAGNFKIRISCPNPVGVKFFSPSCAVDERISVRDPEYSVTNGKVSQFFVTATDLTCSISMQ